MPTWLASLFSGAGAGLLVWLARKIRFGKAQNEQIIAEAAKAAVETIQGSLDYMRMEREELRERVEVLEAKNAGLAIANQEQSRELARLRARQDERDRADDD